MTDSLCYFHQKKEHENVQADEKCGNSKFV